MQEMHEREQRDGQENVASTMHADTNLILGEFSKLREELRALRDQVTRAPETNSARSE